MNTKALFGTCFLKTVKKKQKKENRKTHLTIRKHKTIYVIKNKK